jgi:hypothetical protein
MIKGFGYGLIPVECIESYVVVLALDLHTKAMSEYWYRTIADSPNIRVLIMDNYWLTKCHSVGNGQLLTHQMSQC